MNDVGAEQFAHLAVVRVTHLPEKNDGVHVERIVDEGGEIVSCGGWTGVVEIEDELWVEGFVGVER